MVDEVTPPAQESAPRSRGTLTRAVRALGWTSIIAGVLILGFVVQQLFVTTWFAEQHQDALWEEAVERFDAAEVTEVEYTPPPPDEGAAGPTAAEPRPLLVETSAEEGTAFAVIRIPKIERLSEGWAVVEGVRVRDLKNGAGHMPDTPLPGMPGNSVISGHRTTYGAPFNEVDVLVPGDLIEVETATGVHTYEVRELQIVRPTDVWVTDPREGAWLTLTTCHPKLSSRQRLIVFAELVGGPNYEAIYT